METQMNTLRVNYAGSSQYCLFSLLCARRPAAAAIDEEEPEEEQD